MQGSRNWVVYRRGIAGWRYDCLFRQGQHDRTANSHAHFLGGSGAPRRSTQSRRHQGTAARSMHGTMGASSKSRRNRVRYRVPGTVYGTGTMGAVPCGAPTSDAHACSMKQRLSLAKLTWFRPLSHSPAPDSCTILCKPLSHLAPSGHSRTHRPYPGAETARGEQGSPATSLLFPQSSPQCPSTCSQLYPRPGAGAPTLWTLDAPLYLPLTPLYHTAARPAIPIPLSPLPTFVPTCTWPPPCKP